jgi:hypothetical protein
MKIFIVRVNKKIFKAFTREEDAVKYYTLLSETARDKVVQHLSSYNIDTDLISIPVDEDDSNFDLALHKTIHAGAGSWAVNFEYESFPIKKLLDKM